MTQTTLINDIYGVVGPQGEITDLNIDGKNLGLVRATTGPGGEVGLSIALASIPGAPPSDCSDWMFYRPRGQKRKITVPSPYAALANPYVIHPSAVYAPGGFAGYSHWMAYTPYNGHDSAYENPCICASNDGLTWELPAGAPNPLFEKPAASGAYNSDTHLVMHPDGNTMVLLYRTAFENSRHRLKVSTSQDGRTWTAPVEIWSGVTSPESDLKSPSLWHDPIAGKWVIVGHQTVSGAYELRKITSSDLLSGWDETPVALTFPAPSGRKWWHSWFARLPSGRIVGFAQDYIPGVSSTGNLYICQSLDGQIFEAALIDDIKGVSFANGRHYRPTAYLVERNGTVEVVGIWSYTYAEYLHAQVLKEVGSLTAAEEYKRLPAAVAAAKIGAVKGVITADDFDRADSTTGLGTTLDGKTWVQIYAAPNVIGISGNKAYNAGSSNSIAILDVGLEAYSVSAVLAEIGTQGWIVANRKDAARFWRFGTYSGHLAIERYNGGKDIDGIAPAGTIAPSPGDVLRIDVSGHSAKFYWNGELIYTADGTLFHAATTVGIQATGATPTKFDAFCVERF